MMTYDLDAQLKKENSNVIITALHPGTVRTEITRYMFGNRFYKYTFLSLFSFFIYFFMKSPLHGAQTTLHCALADKKKLTSGAYYVNCGVYKVNKKEGFEQ